jgi:hypothetical protein
MNNPQSQDRMLDLLVAEATQGLSAEEQRELASLRAAGVGDEPGFEELVAALTVNGRRERMPPALRQRILAAAPVREARATQSAAAASPRSAQAGWWAAAASFVLAVAGWWPRLAGNSTPPDPAVARTALIQSPNVVRVKLAAGPGAAGAALTGDVVFDPVTQRGYLLFHDIPANDPRLARYQLWIADGSRKEPEPVDGGVFDVRPAASHGDVIIPFTAKLPVGSPAAFVVTVEQPQGVVVSKQERVLAIGAVSPGA